MLPSTWRLRPSPPASIGTRAWPCLLGGLAINLAWPRQEVFDPDGTNPVLQYFALIIVALTVLGGVVAFTIKKTAYRQAIAGLPGAPTPAEADAPALGQA